MSGGWEVRTVTVALTLIAWPCGESMAATFDALDADGVYTWRVAATDGAPPRCCVRWRNGLDRLLSGGQ